MASAIFVIAGYRIKSGLKRRAKEEKLEQGGTRMGAL
jgi:hypothetical protein